MAAWGRFGIIWETLAGMTETHCQPFQDILYDLPSASRRNDEECPCRRRSLPAAALVEWLPVVGHRCWKADRQTPHDRYSSFDDHNINIRDCAVAVLSL